MPTIRIDHEVYSWLKSQAEPFEDTPNSVLRKLARLDKKTALISDNSITDDIQYDKGAKSTMVLTKSDPILPKRLSGKYLARQWRVNVVHALYHKDGSWYNHLRDFPGALFDPNGYVIFNTEREYRDCPYLQHGQELHAIGGISSIPGYRRVQK
ncbi:MAG: hypothetical protein JW790_01985 [Dehalococcoidales bacterium]|nr:hypothetical protein [Dehalococcoidales bacterium]